MSLINDALKQARKNPPPAAPGALSPLPPVAANARPKNFWLVPVLIVGLMLFAASLIGWVVFHPRTAAVPAPATPPVAPVAAAPAPAPAPPPASEPVVIDLSTLPTLQGILFSPRTPLAIIDGKTVGVGDRFGEYQVKAITKTTATIIGADGKSVQLTMSH
jgi:hypothetical protein